MNKNKNKLYLSLLFVATAAMGVFIGKTLKPQQDAIAEMPVVVDTVTAPEPSIVEERPQQEEVADEQPIKIVAEKVDKPQTNIEPVLSKAEVKQKILNQTFTRGYKLYCSKNRTPKFNIVNCREGERASDENDVWLKVQTGIWKDFEVEDLSCDNKGKITAITIRASY